MFAVGIDTRGEAPEVDMAAHNEIALQTARQGICAKRMAQAPGEFSPSVRASFLSGCLPQVTRWPTAGPRNPVIARPDPVRQASAHSWPQ
jgi:hypothetical protein